MCKLHYCVCVCDRVSHLDWNTIPDENFNVDLFTETMKTGSFKLCLIVTAIGIDSFVIVSVTLT